MNEQALLSLYTAHNKICDLIDIALNLPETRRWTVYHRIVSLRGSVMNLERWAIALDERRKDQEVGR